jgi:hypothetical protein
MPLRLESVRVPGRARPSRLPRRSRRPERGVPWLATAIAKLKDLDVFEDAELVQQQVAACFGAFVTDMEGAPSRSATRTRTTTSSRSFSPGHISYLAPGEDVKFAQPPTPQNRRASRARSSSDRGRPERHLRGPHRRLFEGQFQLGAHGPDRALGGVYVWREHMIVPQLCEASGAGLWASRKRSKDGRRSRRRLVRSADAGPRARQGSRRVQERDPHRHDHVGADDPRARDSTRSRSSKRSSGRTRRSTRPGSSSTWILGW